MTFAVVALYVVVASLVGPSLPFSFDLSGLQENLLAMAETMFNLLVPVIGLIAGITLGIGLVGKILSAIRSAF